MMPTTATGEAVTFHLAPDARAELDELARTVARDRDTLLAEAVAAYLDLNRYHVAQINAGLRQAKAGTFATDAEVDAAFAAFG